MRKTKNYFERNKALLYSMDLLVKNRPMVVQQRVSVVIHNHHNYIAPDGVDQAAEGIVNLLFALQIRC